LMTAGFAAERAGHAAAAIRLDRRALAADPGAAPAANDLGVLLARQGKDDAAVAALRRAVGADEDYAVGWFNLGVVLAGQGPAPPGGAEPPRGWPARSASCCWGASRCGAAPRRRAGRSRPGRASARGRPASCSGSAPRRPA